MVRAVKSVFAAGGEGHDDAHRFGGVRLSLHRSDAQQRYHRK
jgi:hypothetical protein